MSQTQSWNPPTWWRNSGEQLERARQLWPHVVLPELPDEFIPRTASEVLLLHVPDSFDCLWEKVNAPAGYAKYCRDESKFSTENLRLAPNKVEYTKPVWLAFDPEHGKSERPDSFWSQGDIAASEVFSALIQFPEWLLTWNDGASVPALSGYQLKYDDSWSYVPLLRRGVGLFRLELLDYGAFYRSRNCSSPSVRKC